MRDAVPPVQESKPPSPESRKAARDRTFELIYVELRHAAAGLLRHERAGHSLQPTALVHEVYLRLIGKGTVPWESPDQILRICASAMRRILVDHARHVNRRRSDRNARKIGLDGELFATRNRLLDVLAVDEALDRLTLLDPRMASVAELRIFGGLNMDEISRALLVSRRTAYNDWEFARRWLSREVTPRA